MTAVIEDDPGRRSHYDPDVDDEVEPGGPFDDRDLHEGELPGPDLEDPDQYAEDDQDWPRDAA